MAASKIQQMIQLAKNLFLNTARTNSITDRSFAADLERLKQLVKCVTAEDFNVTASLASQPWDYKPYVMDSPAACMEVYECPDFTVGIFLLKPNKCMPLHDHPGMHGIMKMLFGSMTVTSYSNKEPLTTPTSEFLVECVSTLDLNKDSEPCCLYPDNGNIHEIQAKDEPVAFLDILGPSYNPSVGRDCNYYYRQTTKTGSDGLVYLKPGSNPHWFSCVPLKYEGLSVTESD